LNDGRTESNKKPFVPTHEQNDEQILSLINIVFHEMMNKIQFSIRIDACSEYTLSLALNKIA